MWNPNSACNNWARLNITYARTLSKVKVTKFCFIFIHISDGTMNAASKKIHDVMEMVNPLKCYKVIPHLHVVVLTFMHLLKHFKTKPDYGFFPALLELRPFKIFSSTRTSCAYRQVDFHLLFKNCMAAHTHIKWGTKVGTQLNWALPKIKFYYYLHYLMSAWASPWKFRTPNNTDEEIRLKKKSA